jgi:hypothetical protein
LSFFRKRFGKSAPLSGVPAVRRLKTYSAQSGYVYQYYYQGRRTASRENFSGIEHVFEVSSDRKTYQPVSVFLTEQALAGWQTRHRNLNDTERYAIAKMALFQAFDEREDPSLLRHEIRVRDADVDLLLERLNID